MPIRILSERTASQIGAGEVVERPASVVKELVENSIDAGATTINVDIRQGGRTLIQVADNGQGIARDELRTAFLRHATSKMDDSAAALSRIETLGFRGEALAAIASVSLLTVVTRTADGRAGARLVLEGGEVVEDEAVGAAQGTVMLVENLFFNTPARLKFLKSDTSERRAIDELLTRYALAYPQIRWRLTHNKRVTFQSPGSGDRLDAVLAVYGVDSGRELLRIETDAAAGKDIAVYGFISPPGLHRANRSHISIFVNGRWIKDKQLTYAIIEAYHTFLPTGRYPMAILFIDMPFDEVDVNVHPMKSEVRFQHPRKLFSIVQRTVRERLLASQPARPAVGSGFTQFDTQDSWPTRQDRRSDEQDEEQLSWPNGTTQPQMELGVGGERLPLMRVIGQVNSAYIITEGPDGMYLIDQHAAHERILYEQFLAAWENGQLGSQALIAGAAVQLPPAAAALLEEHLDSINRLGFQIESFGPNSFVVRALPALLTKAEPSAALRAAVEALESEETPLQQQIEQAIIKRVCKTAAIKAGQRLSQQEMDALIRQLEQTEIPHTCPHGRPTLIHLSLGHMARQFGRT